MAEEDIRRCGSHDGGVRTAALDGATRVAAAMAWGSDVDGAAVLLESALLASAQAAAGSAAATEVGHLAAPPPAPPATGYTSRLGRPVGLEDLVAVPATPADAAVVSARVCLSLMLRHLARPAVPEELGALLGAPLAHVAEVADSASRFMPGSRAGLQRDVDRWLLNPANQGGVFAVLAGPGFGKTAFASSVCAAQGDAVVAVHLCRSDDDQSRDPVAVVKSIAAQLAQAVPEYREALARDLEAVRTKVDDPKASARSLLRCLVVEPLRTLKPPTTSKLIVIDGLDECERDGGENPLLDLVTGGLGRSLPPWIGVLVTSRPGDSARIQGALEAMRGRSLVAHADAADHAEEGKRDIERYLEGRVAADRVARIVERSEGRFLYVYVLLRLAAAASVVLDDPPRGIDGLYAALFGVACGGAAEFSMDERRVLEAMAAAKTAVHWFHELPLLSGVDAAKCGEVVQRFREVVVRREDGRVRWFHKSVRDWLVGGEAGRGGAFVVEPAKAASRMAAAVLAPLERLADDATGESGGAEADTALLGYAVRYGVVHLCEAGELAAARGRLLDFAWLLRRVMGDVQGPVRDWEL